MKRKIAKKILKRSKNAKLISKSMTFAEIMKKNPAAAEIFIKKGMHCIGCCMAAGETLEQGAQMHGINPDKLVKEINKKNKGWKK